MFLGKVIGRLWATVKNPNFEGQRLLLVQPLTPEWERTGKPVVCAASAGAGAGELGYYCRGREASYAFLPREVPSDSTIVGIVDEVHVQRGKKC
ncbi:MAG: EutN/CcmL family microcompartment protein [Bryobacteraceae bacterium]